MAKLLVVVGATGNQGRSVIAHFQRTEPTWKIRGLTRNTSSETAIALSNSGVEMVKADLNDVSTLISAFAGANFIFAYTDFGGIISSPEVMGKFNAGEISKPIGAESFKIERQHGFNVVDAAATVPELERLIWSSLVDITKWSKGKYTQAFHFDAKAVVAEYALNQKALESKVSILVMGCFMHNVIDGPEQIRSKISKENTALWQPPFPGDMAMPWTDVEADTGSFVKTLINAPAPTQVLAVSEWLTNKDFLNLWSSITGIPNTFIEPHIPDGEAHLDNDPTGLELEFLQTAQFMRDFGFTGGDPDVQLPEDLEKKGYPIARTKIADFITRKDWSKLFHAD